MLRPSRLPTMTLEADAWSPGLGEFGLQMDSRDLFHDAEDRRPYSYVFVLLGFVLVDLVRFELTTSSMPWKRAPNCATGPRVDSPINITRPHARSGSAA